MTGPAHVPSAPPTRAAEQDALGRLLLAEHTARAAFGGRSIGLADARTEDRWPAHIPVFLDRGALSGLAAPVPAARLAAGLDVHAREVEACTADDRSTLGFAAYAGAAPTNRDALQDALDLADDLRRAMDSHAVIEQALGILMERHEPTDDLALRLLAGASQQTHCELGDVAQDLVPTGERALAPPTRRPPLDRVI